MSTIVNISGLTKVEDPSYRYKMPLVTGKIEGKGNGIKTVIPNITEVAMSLHRQPAEVNKFFGCELGAQTTYNEATDRAVVNGAHPDQVLQGMMYKYIESFVLCPNCRLPETHYKIKGGCVWHVCKACGAKEMVDMEHKLCTFILAQDKKAKQEKAKKLKKDKKEGKVSAETDEKKDKKKKKKKSKDRDSDEERKKDKKDKKKKKKKDKALSDEKKLADGVDDLSIGSEAGVDDAGALDLAVEGVLNFMKNTPDATPEAIAEEVANQQMASALKSHDKLKIFTKAVINPTNFFKEKTIETYAPVVQKITKGNELMERHLIGALESICLDKPKNFPVMLKQFYDEEALEENVILKWAFDGRTEFTLEVVDEDARAALRAEAEPFISWLEDSDDSDSSDED